MTQRHRNRSALVTQILGLLCLVLAGCKAAPQATSAKNAVDHPHPTTALNEPVDTISAHLKGAAELWPDIRNFLSAVEGLSAPLPLDELADRLDLNKSRFDRVKISRPFQVPQKRPMIGEMTEYNNVPDSRNSLIINISVVTFRNPTQQGNIVQEYIYLELYPLTNCLPFSLIRNDARALGWDGLEPGNYTGADGVQMEFDQVHFSTSSMTLTADVSSKTSCVSAITGNVSLGEKNAQ